MSNPAISTKSNPWSRLWQVPLLVVGLGLFAYAVRYLAVHWPQVSFETHVADIQKLIKTKDFKSAMPQVAAIDPYVQEAKQQAMLAKLSGDAFFFAQQNQPAVEENCRKG